MFLGPILSSTPEKCRLHGQCQVSPRGGLFFVGFVCYHRPGHAVHRRSVGIEARYSVSHARQLLHKGTGRISLQVYFQVRRFSFIFEPLAEAKCCTKSLLWLELLYDFVGSIFAGLKAGNFTFVFLSRTLRVGIHMPANQLFTNEIGLTLMPTGITSTYIMRCSDQLLFLPPDISRFSYDFLMITFAAIYRSGHASTYSQCCDFVSSI